MKFYLVRCPHCGHYQKTSAKFRVKCVFCGKSFDPKKHIVKGQPKTDEKPLFEDGLEYKK